MASHAGFHDVGAFPQSFESFPFLYVQIPFSHFCCISPESDPVAIQKHQPQVSSVPQICRRKLPNDAISHRLRKSWTQIMSRIRSNRHVSHPPLGKPFVVSHTHTHHLLRSLYGVFGCVNAPRPSPDVGWCEVWFEFPRAQSNTTRQPMLGHLGRSVSEPIQRFHWELYSNIMHDSMHSISHTIHRTGIFIYISVDFYGKCR